MTTQEIIHHLSERIAILPNKADMVGMLRQIQTHSQTVTVFGVTITADMATEMLVRIGA